MKMIVDIDMASKVNSCQEGIDTVENYRKMNNLPYQTFDEIIDIYKQSKRRDFATWMLENRNLYIQAGNYTITAEEDATDAHELQLATTLDGTISGYSFLNTTYATIDDAQNAKQAWVNQNTVLAKETISASEEIFNENGDATWIPINMDTITELPSGSFIQLFNPVTGEHTQYSTLTEAKNAYNQIVENALMQRFGNPAIFKVMVHSVYGDTYLGDAV
jgi:hypothetical protein